MATDADEHARTAQSCVEVGENGHRLVVRNGCHQPREVLTAAGAVAVGAPRVNDIRVDADTDVRQRFSSAIVPAWARKWLTAPDSPWKSAATKATPPRL